MERKVKYPDIAARDSVIDRVSVNSISEIRAKTMPSNTVKTTAKLTESTSSSNGDMTFRKTVQKEKGGDVKYKDKFLSVDSQGNANLQITKQKSGDDAKHKMISGKSAIRRF